MKKLLSAAILTLLIFSATAMAKEQLTVYCSDTPSACDQIKTILSRNYNVNLIKVESNTQHNAGHNTTIRCPVCNSPIKTQIQQLLTEELIACPVCKLKISMTREKPRTSWEDYRELMDLK